MKTNYSGVISVFNSRLHRFRLRVALDIRILVFSILWMAFVSPAMATDWVWFDDALPSDAVTNADNGDNWTWVTTPAPLFGNLSHQSNLTNIEHHHEFAWTYSRPLMPVTNDVLFAYVYLDPTNPPSEVMLQWFDSSWEHRAYWGSNALAYGTDGTTSRTNMGALPRVGQWARLEVRARDVGLEGSTVLGLSFVLYGGRANWDTTGKSDRFAGTSDTVWFDDSLPSGAVTNADGGDYWNWISSNPTPFSGSLAHQSIVAPYEHQHSFAWNYSSSLMVNTGDVLFAYAYLNPASLPNEMMLAWFLDDGSSWNHGAYWGANNLSYGTDGTASRTNQGAIPAANQWVRLQVPASQVGLEGKSLLGMTFILDSGGATWDLAGKANTNVWFDDAWPDGSAALGSEPWTWVSSNPSPYSGLLAHQSALTNGLHEHAFSWTTNPFLVNTGATVYAYVYLDPTYPPDEIMLGFNTTEGQNFWEHRAYWGANDISIYGTDGTASRTNMGVLPPTGQWVRLEVPASKVNLEGFWLRGMSFVAYSANNSRVTWDVVGKYRSSNLPPTVTLTNPANNATYYAPGTIQLSATASDPDGTVAKVEFFSGSTKIGEADSSPYNFTWSGVAAGTYSITAKATDNLGAATTSSPVTVIVNNNNPPTVTLTSPANNASFTTPVNISLSANASDSDGTITSVAFYENNTLIGQTSTSPYTFTWNNVVVGGTYSLAAWATDNDGAVTISSPVTITVNNTPPTVSLTSPASNASFLAPATISLNASASDANGTVAKVEFFENGNKIGEADSSPYTFSWTSVAAGNYSLTAKATDNGGASTTSSAASITVTNSDGSTGGPVTGRQLPNGSIADGVLLSMPAVDDHTLNILSPTNLELVRITAQPQSGPPSAWNWVNNGSFTYPGNITVVVNGVTNNIVKTGFKRRVLYAPIDRWDLRIDNELYLQLATPIADNQSVQVISDGVNWPTTMLFTNTANPLRYSPAIHVNQEGYLPSFTKQAMVGYYLGSLGEMSVGATSFTLVRTADGVPVYTNALVLHNDVGFNVPSVYPVAPYQKVLLADFTAFQIPGEYRLQVPGLGSSLPFLIDNGIAMDFLRTYALGLYHQRCGSANGLPYTRFAHNECHTNLAVVPLPDSNFPITWNNPSYSECISNQSQDTSLHPDYQRGQPILDPSDMYYGYSNTAPRDISGGHHDAGDYSKYTVNVASLIHTLVFAADSFPGVAQFDNLGIPESGDGKSDILQEAKWEADYLMKIQDTDGGFFFLVYPTNGFYETTPPDAPGQQNLWPKNTSATAAAVGALAEIGSSPTFKQQFPQSASNYLNAALAGWSFITNAMAKHGDATSYQKLTFYGDDYTHTDEVAWAACELFLATTNNNYANVMKAYMPDPANTPQFDELIDDFAYAQQAYVFGARSGRVLNSALDPLYLASCSNELCGTFANNRLNEWSSNSYGTSFQLSNKGGDNPGWYFSMDHALDMAVGYALNTNSAFIPAILGNLNYEAGCNPVNVSFLAGTGWRRQHQVVNQYTRFGNWRILPPTGTDSGNLQQDFDASENNTYTPGILQSLTFPDQSNTDAVKYPVYDRWADAYNLTTEFVTMNVARALSAVSLIAGQTSLTNQPWHFANCTMTLSTNHSYSSAVDATLQLTNTDLTDIRVVWEVQGMEPVFTSNLVYHFTPTTEGTNLIEAELQWPDGRRAFATNVLMVTLTNLNVVWFDDALPQGAVVNGGDTEPWTWVGSNPAPESGSLAHQSEILSGEHVHSFAWASQTLSATADDDLYSWIYPDPSNPPQAVALQWFDENGNFHVAYWGPDLFGFGSAGHQVSTQLPPNGQWTQLSVHASDIGMDGQTASGMYFFLYGGRATWDVAGKKSKSP